MKIMLFGVSLSSSQHKFLSIYFLVRFTIYASTFFFILGQLRVIRYYVLKKGQLLSILNKRTYFFKSDGNWQLANFNKVFYVSLFGISMDVVSFGNYLNFHVWIAMMIVWVIYELNKYMSKNHNWKYLKHIF